MTANPYAESEGEDGKEEENEEDYEGNNDHKSSYIEGDGVVNAIIVRDECIFGSPLKIS